MSRVDYFSFQQYVGNDSYFENFCLVNVAIGFLLEILKLLPQVDCILPFEIIMVKFLLFCQLLNVFSSG